MAKRILEKTLANGEKRYCVRSNTIFGIPTKWWHTMTILVDNNISTDAIFSSLENAKLFMGVGRQVVNRKVIEV